jgi:protein-S-isoprenylcysteine O-methyltransferase
MSGAQHGDLAEPLLEEIPSGVPRPMRGARTAGRPVAWKEWGANGRGLAATTAFCLGTACTLSASCLPMLLPSAIPFFCYFSLLCIFHMSEYLLTAAFRPDTLSFDNFLLNHSRAYQLMVGVAWAEYWLEWFAINHFGCCGWWPGGKSWGPLNMLGLLICLVGLGTRCLGMWTASTNFSHKIEEHKREEHALVTHGIYAYLRHPAYFGFFWWSVGTQVLLGNPLCLIAYTAASWNFFYDRIPTEEELLIEFFGDRYRSYRKATMVGIPGIDWATRGLVG